MYVQYIPFPKKKDFIFSISKTKASAIWPNDGVAPTSNHLMQQNIDCLLNNLLQVIASSVIFWIFLKRQTIDLLVQQAI